jgi:hypothetical protein
MLTDYRTWLESELKLLGNASHHAYSFGQANMAKRAIERFDQEVTGRVALLLPRGEAAGAADALAALAAAGTLPPELGPLRQGLEAALGSRAE